MKVKTI